MQSSLKAKISHNRVIFHLIIKINSTFIYLCMCLVFPFFTKYLKFKYHLVELLHKCQEQLLELQISFQSRIDKKDKGREEKMEVKEVETQKMRFSTNLMGMSPSFSFIP